MYRQDISARYVRQGSCSFRDAGSCIQNGRRRGMPRDTPPYRADHVGSLLRPQKLLEARKKHADGEITDHELRQVEDDAIQDVVRMQEEVGLQSATDGEFRRAAWHMDFIYSLDGISKA